MTTGPLIVDIASTTVSTSEREVLTHPAVGGLILFQRNIDTYSQLAALVAEVRAIRGELLICVDQEGGRVQRCREGFTRLPPMQVFDELYSRNREDALRLASDLGWLLAAEILAVGIDFSFAPVLDIDDHHCSAIGNRSFSADPVRVSELGGAFIAGAHEAGMAVTGKHFPGHGSVPADSHLELPVDHRDLEEVKRRDLLPFTHNIHCCDAIMPAHILFPNVDPKAPVCFSALWLQHVLRGEMGFRGLIFSDDLSMQGAAVIGDPLARVQAALAAGCDMALLCNNGDAVADVIARLDLHHILNKGVEHEGYAQHEGKAHSGIQTEVAQSGDVQSGGVDCSAMRARASKSRAELRRESRWQRTSERISDLI